MGTTRRGHGPHLAVLSLVIAALTLAACGGNDADERPGTTGPSAGAAPATTTAEPAATADLPTAIVSPGVLSAYRYTITLHVAGTTVPSTGGTPPTAPPVNLAGASFTIDIDGEVVNPDREHTETKATLGFIALSLERIQIGDRAWTREAGGEWKPATPGAASPVIGGDLDISPARIFADDGSAFAALNHELGLMNFMADAVDGLPARRYELDPTQFQSVFGGEPGLLPGDSEPLETRGTLWIAEDSRVPVRIQLTSTARDGAPAFEMDLTLTDLNEAITIEPPA